MLQCDEKSQQEAFKHGLAGLHVRTRCMRGQKADTFHSAWSPC